MRYTKFLVFSMILISGCKNDNNKQECSDDLACTEIFQTITLKLLQDGEPVILDYFKTINTDSGVIHDFQNMELFEDGLYPILTDAQMDEVLRNGTNYLFEGSIDGAVIIDQVFLIGHDCCHIIVLEGPDQIEIQ